MIADILAIQNSQHNDDHDHCTLYKAIANYKLVLKISRSVCSFPTMCVEYYPPDTKARYIPELVPFILDILHDPLKYK